MGDGALKAGELLRKLGADEDEVRLLELRALTCTTWRDVPLQHQEACALNFVMLSGHDVLGKLMVVGYRGLGFRVRG